MEKLTTAQTLQTRLLAVLHTVEYEFKTLPDEQLRWKPDPESWSIMECLQHLNLAERFYIRNIQHKVDALGMVQTNPVDQKLESDWVGKVLMYAVDPAMKIKVPSPGIVRPRRSTDLNPKEVIDQFVDLQKTLHTLLDKAVYLDWNQEKVGTLFGNWLKIRLGDLLQMLVAHTERHINQAIRVKVQINTTMLQPK